MTRARPLLRKAMMAAFFEAAADDLLHDLEEAGALFLGGALAGGDGSPAGALAVLRAADVAAAHRMLGGAATRILPWSINEGRLAPDLAFSRCSLFAASEPDVFLIETRCADRARLEAALTAHMDHQFALEDRGLLLAAGPLRDADTGRFSGSGLIVCRAADEEEALALAAADPMHLSGARTYTLQRWRITHGTLSLRIRLSDRSFALG